MLQTIREHTQGWFAGVIISLIIMSFALWGIHSYFVGGASNVVAIVNGIDITNQQLASAYDRLRRQMMTQYGANAVNSNNQNAVKNKALRGLIDMEVLSQAALAQGFYISDQQIDSYLQSMPEFQVNGQFSIERFQEVLTSSQLSDGEFLKLIRTSLLIDQPKVGVVFTSFAMPEQTDYSIKLINQDRDISYLKLPYSYFDETIGTIADKDILTYYNNHKNDFMTPEQVTVDYIELTVADIAKTITPTDDELMNYYKENNTSYMSPPAWKLKGFVVPFPAKDANDEQIAATKTKAEQIYQALEKDNNFDSYAAKYAKYKFPSTDFMNAKQVPAPLQDTLTSETKANQVLEPVQTEDGFVIAKVVAYRESKMQDYATVKDKVRESYVKLKAEEKFAEAKERLADLTYENPTTLESAAKELKLTIKKSDYFTADKPGAGITQYKKVRNAAFNNDVLNLKNNSDVIQINNDDAVVLRVNSHLPASLLPLDQVKDRIDAKITEDLSEKQTADLAALIIKKLQAGEPIDAIMNQYHLTWQNTGFIGRYSTKVDNAILDAAFRLPNVGTKSTKAYYSATRTPDGYAVISLKAVRDGASTDDKQKTVFAEQMQSNDGLLEYELYKQSQINAAKIKLYQ